MASVDGSVEDLTLAIVSEARLEAEELNAQAESKAEAIHQRAQAEAVRLRKGILEKATQDADRLRAQALAAARLKARAEELQHREQLFDGVFAAVRDRLPSVRQRKDYPEIAAQLVREALLQLHSSKAEILADEQTRRALASGSLENLADELQVEVSLGAVLDEGSGVIAQTGDGHLHFDNTLENRLGRLQGALRSTVYRILAGETP